MPDIELLTIVEAFWKWRYYLIYVLYFIKVFMDHLNHCYLVTKAKLSGREARWIEELTTFDFTIIYCKRTKNPTNGLFRRSNFKDDSELSTTRHQPFLNFLSKFQEYLGGAKSDLVEE